MPQQTSFHSTPPPHYFSHRNLYMENKLFNVCVYRRFYFLQNLAFSKLSGENIGTTKFPWNRQVIDQMLSRFCECRLITYRAAKNIAVLAGRLVFRIGRNCVISERSVMRPPSKRTANKISFYPLIIGDCVFIEEDVVLQATTVGSYVHIGKGSVIGKRVKLGDCSAVLPNSYLPPDTVVQTFAVYGGSPAKLVDELPESQQILMNEACRTYYNNFKPVSNS